MTLKNINAKLGAGAACAFAVAAAVLWSTEYPARAITTALTDPLSILDGRSPGTRASGALFQTKERYAARPRFPVRERPPGVEERVLTLVRSRPPGVPPMAGVPPFMPQQPGFFPSQPFDGFGAAPGVRPRASEQELAAGPDSIGGGGVSSDYTAPAAAPSA